MSNEDSNSSPLLALPAEIRNEIWQNAVVLNKSISITSKAPFVSEPALLATCSQIRNEALAIFYGAITFQSSGARRTERFLKRIDPKCGNLIRSLQFAYGHWAIEEWHHLSARAQVFVCIANLTFALRHSEDVHKQDDVALVLRHTEDFFKDLKKRGKQASKLSIQRGLRRDALGFPIPSVLENEIVEELRWVPWDAIDGYEAVCIKGAFYAQRKHGK